MFLKLLEFALIAFVIWFIITQVIMPVWHGTKLFPLFRKQWKLEHELEDVKQEVSDHHLEEVIEKTREQLNKKEESK